MTDISNPIFQNEDKASAYLESVRWPDGPFCPFCGEHETVKALPPKGSMGKGWYHCRACRKKFTVRVGTLYERSHVPLHKWLLATHLMCASKKGISAHQLHRMLGVTYKTAWFMAHRIREGMRDSGSDGPLGGEGKVVEADETYFGGKKKGVRGRKRQGPGGKNKVVTLVERGGPVRSFKVAHANADTVREILFTNASRKSQLMTDESGIYTSLGIHFAGHRKVMHSAGEYVKRDDRSVHSNTVEN
jgi:transposase-like protein